MTKKMSELSRDELRRAIAVAREELARVPQAQQLASLARVASDFGGVAELLVACWPDHFSVEPGLLSHALYESANHEPFRLQEAQQLYDDLDPLPDSAAVLLEPLVVKALINHYRLPFNQRPKQTLDELHAYATGQSAIAPLAKQVWAHWNSIYEFEIPGYGTLAEACRNENDDTSS